VGWGAKFNELCVSHCLWCSWPGDMRSNFYFVL